MWRRAKIAMSCVLALLGCGCAFAEDAKDAVALEQSLALATSSVRKGELKSAAVAYDKALSIAQSSFGAASKEYANVSVLRGELELKRHNLSAAEKAFEAALQIAAYHPERVRTKVLYNDLSTLYEMQGKTAQAASLREAALELNEQGYPANGPGGIIIADRYPQVVQQRITKHWFPPEGHELAPIEVSFTIMRTGAISELRLVSSDPSGFAAADKAALKAVQDAAPFPPLPVGAGESLQIGFNFINAVNMKPELLKAVRARAEYNQAKRDSAR